jgi:putative spermidine/putrescine transport system ATP-binding protein
MTSPETSTITPTTSTMAAPSAPSSLPGAPVEFDGLVRRFGATLALDNFSLSIDPGEFIALLGPSGCGKTTALRMLAGFETPDTGRVLVDGVDMARVPAQKRDMGMVFQSYSLFPNMNARGNVEFGLQLRGQRGPVRKNRANELLELVGLSEHVTKYPHQLSGGQQQRVALARALAIEPRVLLLDEPLSALDAKVRAELRDQIRAIQQRLAITTVFVTHDQEEALSMADRVCVMYRGHLEQVATPSVLYSAPATGFVAQFVGISSHVPGPRRGDAIELFGELVKIRGDLTTVPQGNIEAVLRPEDLALTPDATGLGVITSMSFFGSVTRAEVGIAGLTVKIDIRSSDAEGLLIGNRVNVRVSARDVLVTTPQPTK